MPLGTVDEVIALGQYHPYRILNAIGEKVKNPDFDQFSGYVLDIKDPGSRNFKAAIHHFVHELDGCLSEISKGIALSIGTAVPGHKKGSESVAMTALLRFLGPRHSFVPVPDLLTRTTTIEKLANGGDRAIWTHLQSIQVNGPQHVRGKTILLLDDVITTGNSIAACANLLLGAGALRVVPVVLARTTY